jgi:hypothetical protein
MSLTSIASNCLDVWRRWSDQGLESMKKMDILMKVNYYISNAQSFLHKHYLSHRVFYPFISLRVSRVKIP